MNQDTANSFVLKDPYPNQKQYQKYNVPLNKFHNTWATSIRILFTAPEKLRVVLDKPKRYLSSFLTHDPILRGNKLRGQIGMNEIELNCHGLNRNFQEPLHVFTTGVFTRALGCQKYHFPVSHGFTLFLFFIQERLTSQKVRRVLPCPWHWLVDLIDEPSEVLAAFIKKKRYHEANNQTYF